MKKTSLLFDAAITALLTYIYDLHKEYYKDMEWENIKPEKPFLDGGTKFLRITIPRQGVYCFVATEDGQSKELGSYKEGDIFKAASWKAPAKHVRGNIYTDLSKCRHYGMEYIK